MYAILDIETTGGKYDEEGITEDSSSEADNTSESDNVTNDNQE